MRGRFMLACVRLGVFARILAVFFHLSVCAVRRKVFLLLDAYHLHIWFVVTVLYLETKFVLLVRFYIRNSTGFMYFTRMLEIKVHILIVLMLIFSHCNCNSDLLFIWIIWTCFSLLFVGLIYVIVCVMFLILVLTIKLFCQFGNIQETDAILVLIIIIIITIIIIIIIHLHVT
jgi:hypothetical protein